jgi:hypothetical protein
MKINSNLLIIGDDFNPDHINKLTSLKVHKIVYKGEYRHNLPNAKIMEYSYVEILVTESTQKHTDWNDTMNQIISFLNENKQDLSKVNKIDGVEYFNLEILVEIKACNFERFYFSPDLIKLCSEFNISIELSFLNL